MLQRTWGATRYQPLTHRITNCQLSSVGIASHCMQNGQNLVLQNFIMFSPTRDKISEVPVTGTQSKRWHGSGFEIGPTTLGISSLGVDTWKYSFMYVVYVSSWDSDYSMFKVPILHLAQFRCVVIIVWQMTDCENHLSSHLQAPSQHEVTSCHSCCKQTVQLEIQMSLFQGKIWIFLLDFIKMGLYRIIPILYEPVHNGQTQ